MTTSARPTWARAGGLVVAYGLLLACSSGEDAGPEGRPVGGFAAASCAAVVVLDGQRYLGTGGLVREPDTTGTLVDGVVPGCNDTGGSAEAEGQVQLAELADVPLDTAVLFNDAVYVREGRELPAAAQEWFAAPECTSAEAFDLTGDWIGVTSPKEPRFDGDIRPPYRIEVRVTDGPDDYLGSTLHIHADEATDPGLGPDDVKESLWEGGQVSGHVRCDGDRFVAVSLRVPRAG